MPPVCPQDGYNSTQYSEDCLYAVIYAPVATLESAQASKTPVYVWSVPPRTMADKLTELTFEL